MTRKRCHSKARRVAHTQTARHRRRQRDGSLRRPRTSDVLDEVEAQRTREIDRQHLGLERQGEHAARPHRLEVAAAELAVPVHRGGAHQVADLGDLRECRLASVREACHDMLEQPHALVRAREHQVEGVAPARLLPRDVLPIVRQERVVDRRRGEHEGRVPLRRDHPIGALGRIEVIGEGHEPQHSAGGRDAIDDLAVTLRIEIETLALETPPLPCHPANEGAHEAHPRGMECAHPRESHHLRGRAERDVRDAVRAGGWPQHACGHRGVSPVRKQRRHHRAMMSPYFATNRPQAESAAAPASSMSARASAVFSAKSSTRILPSTITSSTSFECAW